MVEFDHFKTQAGLPSFVLSASEWIDKTGAIGLVVKKGRYGGTYAYKDIAFEFGTAISVPFKLYLIEKFQQLKEKEQAQLGWTAKRELSNYQACTLFRSYRQSCYSTHIVLFTRGKQQTRK